MMKAEKSRKRLFGAGILLLMTLLAICTVVFAVDESPSTSYSVTIKKELAADSPSEARNKNYNFKLEGYELKEGKPGDKIEKYVTVYVDENGKGQVTVGFDSAVQVTAVELTDPKGKNDTVGLAYTDRESSMDSSGRTEGIVISKGGDKGKFSVERKVDTDNPDNKTAIFFHVVGKCFEEHDHEGHNGDIVYDEKLQIAPGETGTLTNLPMGNYTVEEMTTEPGFKVNVDTREIEVPGGTGQEGTFYINSNSGSVTITAPDLSGGDEMEEPDDNEPPVDNPDDTGDTGNTGTDYVPQRTHYYTVEKDGSVYKKDIEIKSGESYKLENLPKGEYTVYVSKPYEASPGNYTLTWPVTETKTVSKTLSSLTSGGRTWYTANSFDTDADYISKVNFGPLQTSSGNSLSNSKYNFAIGTNTAEGKVNVLSTFLNRNGGRTVTYDFIPTNNVIRFSVYGVTDTSAKKFKVSWIENKRETTSEVEREANVRYPFQVDERGWVEISKPYNEGDYIGEAVHYYYTITDAQGTPITDYQVTEILDDGTEDIWEGDAEGATVSLMSGDKVRISGLAAGTYKIKETVSETTPMSFNVTVGEEEQSVTSAGGSFSGSIRGDRVVTLTKFGSSAQDGGREYTFELTDQTDLDNPVEIKVKAGEKVNLAEKMGITAPEGETAKLPTGDYSIRVVDDGYSDYRLTYSDSSSVKVTSTTEATITFTNHFTEEEYSYRFIHEYYYKNSDGTYDLEGISAVETRNGEDGTTYTAADVTLEQNFKGYTYKHCGDAYGIAAVWKEGDGAAPADQADEIQAEPVAVEEPEDVQEPEETREPENVQEPEDVQDTEETQDPEENQEPEEAQNPEDPEDVEEGDEPASAEGLERLEAILGDRTEETDKKPYTHREEAEGPHQIYKYCYTPVDGWKSVQATDDSNGSTQIIILRYYREDPTPVEGSYNVVHLYYYRGKGGDVFEGRSAIEKVSVGALTSENRATKYTADGVARVYDFTAFDSKQYTYAYDSAVYGILNNSEAAGTNEDCYTPDTTMEFVYATEDGKPIIVLRYYRGDAGYYNIVHEYYYREADNSEEPIPGTGGDETDVPEESGGIQSRSGTDEAEADTFGGTLSVQDGYTYTYEGRSGIEKASADLGSVHEASESLWKTSHTVGGTEYAYTHLNDGYGNCDYDQGEYGCVSYMTSAEATEEGDEVIILRYYRGDAPTPDNPPPDTPAPPDDPTPPGGGGGTQPKDPPPEEPKTPPETPETPPEEPEAPPETPETPPEDPETPPETPETPPENPGYPTELPDPNDPDSPEEITIWEDGVPKTYVRVWDPEEEEWVYLPEDEVPLGKAIPETGDDSHLGLWMFLAAGSLMGTILLDRGKKREGRF